MTDMRPASLRVRKYHEMNIMSTKLGSSKEHGQRKIVLILMYIIVCISQRQHISAAALGIWVFLHQLNICCNHLLHQTLTTQDKSLFIEQYTTMSSIQWWLSLKTRHKDDSFYINIIWHRKKQQFCLRYDCVVITNMQVKMSEI